MQIKDGKMFSIIKWMKKVYYTYDVSKLEGEIKYSKAMVLMLLQLKQEKQNLSQREQEALDYHKSRLPTLEGDLEQEKNRLVDHNDK